jgi:hypothetical protein
MNGSIPEARDQEWRRIDQGGEIFFEKNGCVLPAYRSGTPEWYRRLALVEENNGDAGQARSFRREAERIELRSIQRILGEHIYLTTSVAHLLAALLRNGRKMPRGAQRWVAQQALEVWLPCLPPADRREVIAILRQCSARQLGKELAKQLGAFGES